MSYEQSRKDIQSFFSSNFTGVTSDKIRWDNVSGDDLPVDEAWVRLSIQNNGSQYVSFGPSRRTRRSGLVSIQVFVPKDTETLALSQIIDNAVNVFETNLLSGTVFESPDVREIGVDKAWYQTNITVPFYFDDLTSIA